MANNESKFQSFRTKIPSILDGSDLYWDASFIIEYFIVDKAIDNTDKKQKCDNFGDYLLFNPEKEFSNATSDFAINEALYIRIKMAALANLIPQNPNILAKDIDWLSWIDGPGSGFIQSLKPEFEKIIEQVNDYLWIIQIDRGFHLSSSAISIMTLHDMMPTDSYHIALSKYRQIKRYVTLDGHFGKYDDCIIYYY